MAYDDTEHLRLRDENARLKRDLTAREEALRRKNLELDALHFVWCSGGCETGVHRRNGKGSEAVTREVVEEAIRNTDRLIEWFGQHEFKRQWREMDAGAQARYRAYQEENTRLREALGDIVNPGGDLRWILGRASAALQETEEKGQ